VFFMDIILNLNTTFYDIDGEEIIERKKIIKNYVFGMFSIDLISSLPLESIPSIPTQFRILNMLKIIRVGRITTIINKANFAEETKSRLRIYQIVFLLMVVIHCIACTW